MTKDFHDKPFDQATELKLDIFRSYASEWLPVFLSKKTYSQVNILDFFAGPGRDLSGKDGSPLIIVKEVERYLLDPQRAKVPGVAVGLYFNEYDSAKYEQLRDEMREIERPQAFRIETDNKDFTKAFAGKIELLRSRDTANLVILDQSGFKQITSEVFRELVCCGTTDILFFVSSSVLGRFTTHETVEKHHPNLDVASILAAPRESVHRAACAYYRNLIPASSEYFLAPFSIKKGRNIYGLIFGSNYLLGLEKFLSVCWNLDEKTGEANYNIDSDLAWEDDTLFAEMNVPTKRGRFERDLILMIQKGGQDNNDIYRFCLENGFLPKHGSEVLRALQKDGRLRVIPENVRKGIFYIAWKYYQRRERKVTFEISK